MQRLMLLVMCGCAADGPCSPSCSELIELRLSVSPFEPVPAPLQLEVCRNTGECGAAALVLPLPFPAEPQYLAVEGVPATAGLYQDEGGSTSLLVRIRYMELAVPSSESDRWTARLFFEPSAAIRSGEWRIRTYARCESDEACVYATLEQ